jgi:hypothetical protein
MGIETRDCKYSLELLMMSGVPLETCRAFEKLWNNKFYYTAAFCWYFYRVNYGARIQEYKIYSMAVTSVRIRSYSIWPALYYTLKTGGTSQRTFFRLLRVPRREHSRPPPRLPLFILYLVTVKAQ